MYSEAVARSGWRRDRRLLAAVGSLGSVGDFFAALARPHTYLPQRNPYCVFGLAWGLPVPVVAIGVHLAAIGAPWTLGAAVDVLRAHPFHVVFLLHPALFAAVFGAIGTVVLEREERIASLIHDLRIKADTDGLTGLFNHRAFQTRIRDLVQRAEGPISLLLLDLDRFKAFNDLHGHPAGDELLKALGGRIAHSIRDRDVACRYGGEEFAVLLPGSDLEEAGRVADRLRVHVVGEPFRLNELEPVRVTLSGGATQRRPGEPVPDWIARTDRLLYRAKDAGRDRILSES